ncbi:hypothetical protein IFM5058_09665 [Aspergillus udagawae]|nr:hypothetical protein IFM5058_09665 [Aspergillus udagawae]
MVRIIVERSPFSMDLRSGDTPSMLKAAGALFLLLAVTLKTAFLIGETRVGGLQLMMFPLEARIVGIFRHVGIPQSSVECHQARSVFCKNWILVIQSL